MHPTVTCKCYLISKHPRFFVLQLLPCPLLPRLANDPPIPSARYSVASRRWQFDGATVDRAGSGSDDVPFALVPSVGSKVRAHDSGCARGRKEQRFLSPANFHTITASRQCRSARSRPLLSNC